MLLLKLLLLRMRRLVDRLVCRRLRRRSVRLPGSRGCLGPCLVGRVRPRWLLLRDLLLSWRLVRLLNVRLLGGGRWWIRPRWRRMAEWRWGGLRLGLVLLLRLRVLLRSLLTTTVALAVPSRWGWALRRGGRVLAVGRRWLRRVTRWRTSGRLLGYRSKVLVRARGGEWSRLLRGCRGVHGRHRRGRWDVGRVRLGGSGC